MPAQKAPGLLIRSYRDEDFADLSKGSPISWNWSFGDGNYSAEQNPAHTFYAPGNYSVSLLAANSGASDNLTRTDYISAQLSVARLNATVIFNSMSPTMFQGEHYLVDIKVNNTGTATWYGDPANAGNVYLQGIGGASDDAAKFNITRIPMIFTNETVAPNESYDFFFYVQAPDTIGTYTPQYQLTTAAGETFGPVSNVAVNVIENPFHPVMQPDGSKLYTTPFGNTTSGISVNVVGPIVYLNELKAAGFQDPRYRINPALKSGVFDLALNDSFSYADVTIHYDPAKTSTPANLELGYFNQTTGNYTFVPSTVDTASHTVTARVAPGSPIISGSTVGALDAVQYHALPVDAQNEMGYIDISPSDYWQIEDTNLGSFSTIWFGNGVQYPPGNYTIYTSGYYNDAWLGWFVDCGVASTQADQNYGNNLGMQVDYTGTSGGVEAPVSSVRVSSGVLKINHAGGTIGVRNKAYSSSSCCGDVVYRIYYGDGPVFPDNDTAYYSDLNNDQFNATQTGYDAAVIGYQAIAGCVLGQAGKRGGLLDSVHSLIPGWSSAINDDVTNSPAYLVGQVACGMAFPEVTLARDFISDVARGDGIGATLDSLGYLGRVQNLLKNTGVISQFMIRNPESDVRLINGLNDQRIFDGVSYVDKLSMYNEASQGAANRLVSKYGTTSEDMENVYLGAKQPLSRIETFLDTPSSGNWAGTLQKSADVNLYDHYYDHVIKNNEWGSDIGLASYKQKAIYLFNKRDSTVELYYQKGYDSLAVYDRTNNEYVTGTINGDIVTFFKPREDYIDEVLMGKIIRLN